MASTWGRNVARLIAASVVVGVGLGAFAVAESSGRFTTYPGSSPVAAAFTLGAGLALTAAGAAVAASRAGGRTGDLAILAGFLWFAPVWVGWQDGPALVRTLGMVAAGFTFPVLLHLVLAHPGGRTRSTPARILVAAVYAEAALAAAGLALFRDPYFDPGCWSNCTVNVFLVHSVPGLARGIQLVDRWFMVAAAAALAAILVRRLALVSGPARRTLVPVALPAIALAGAVVAHTVALHRIPVEDPSHPAFLSIFAAQSSAVLLLAAGLVLAVVRTRSQRRAVSRMVTDLGEAPPPGSLESALGRALGDPALRIAYWLPSSERYVDANGRPVDPPSGQPGRAVTTLVRDDRPIAVVSHGGAFTELEREIGPAVRLGLENERLQAEVLAQIDQLRASRARIVETGDAERRRLERNLHDGAQQRLLALSYDIRLARAAAESNGDGATQTTLADGVDEAQAALRELRELAHGIFPAILAEAGLQSALETLADSAPLPVEVNGFAEDRLPAPVEMAAYVMVAETLDDAIARRATVVTVAIAVDQGRLVVTVTDDGSPRQVAEVVEAADASMVGVADRVGAVGGALDVGPRTLQASIPCA